MPKLPEQYQKIPMPDVRKLPIIDDISYFCKFDELSGVIACPGIRLRSLADSCFVTREQVFGPIEKKEQEKL